MRSINKDVATLTTVPEKTLNKLSKRTALCICEAVLEDALADNDKEISELDIGIGTLYIKYIGAEVKFHFEPSDFLKTTLNKTIETKESPLEQLIRDKLSQKISDVYKDLC